MSHCDDLSIYVYRHWQELREMAMVNRSALYVNEWSSLEGCFWKAPFFLNWHTRVPHIQNISSPIHWMDTLALLDLELKCARELLAAQRKGAGWIQFPFLDELSKVLKSFLSGLHTSQCNVGLGLEITLIVAEKDSLRFNTILSSWTKRPQTVPFLLVLIFIQRVDMSRLAMSHLQSLCRNN